MPPAIFEMFPWQFGDRLVILWYSEHCYVILHLSFGFQADRSMLRFYEIKLGLLWWMTHTHRFNPTALIRSRSGPDFFFRGTIQLRNLISSILFPHLCVYLTKFCLTADQYVLKKNGPCRSTDPVSLQWSLGLSLWMFEKLPKNQSMHQNSNCYIEFSLLCL